MTWSQLGAPSQRCTGQASLRQLKGHHTEPPDGLRIPHIWGPILEAVCGQEA